MLHDQRIDQSATSIQSLLNTNGATFLMKSHVRSALWTLDEIVSQLEEMKQPIDDDLALILLIRSRLTVLSPHSKARWQTLKRMAT